MDAVAGVPILFTGPRLRLDILLRNSRQPHRASRRRVPRCLMEEAASPAAGLAAGDANLLILISVLSLLAWFADLCRRILHMYSLSAAVASGGLVRLEPDRSISELQMLWNMNMRQQLLRARRASAGVAVSQIQVPWSVKDVRCSAHAGADGRRAMRLRFSYTGTAAASAQLFWGMETGAVQRLIRRANLSAPGGHCGGRAARASLFTLLRKNAWSRFGNRYTAVQNRETAAGSAGADALSMDGHLLEASVGFFGAGSRSALFKDHECVGRSEPFAVPAGRDCVFEEEVPLASARERADLGSEGRGGGAAGLALHDDRGLGSTRVGGEAADEAESGQTADAQLDILREGDGGEIGAAIGDAAGTSAWNETSGNEDREAPLFPLVIAVSFDEEAAGPTEQPSHGALGNRYPLPNVNPPAVYRRVAVPWLSSCWVTILGDSGHQARPQADAPLLLQEVWCCSSHACASNARSDSRVHSLARSWPFCV